MIKDRHESQPERLKLNLQHGSLKPRLRDYQKLAVWWMLNKEHYGQVQDQSMTGTDSAEHTKWNQLKSSQSVIQRRYQMQN